MEGHMVMEAVAYRYGIVTISSYKQRYGRQVVHHKCDREGVDRNLHGLVEETRVLTTKGSVLVECPLKGVRK